MKKSDSFMIRPAKIAYYPQNLVNFLWGFFCLKNIMFISFFKQMFEWSVPMVPMSTSFRKRNIKLDKNKKESPFLLIFLCFILRLGLKSFKWKMFHTYKQKAERDKKSETLKLSAPVVMKPDFELKKDLFHPSMALQSAE